MSMTDIQTKRNTLNNAIDSLVTVKETGTATDIQNALTTVQAAGNDLAKTIGVERKANPGLPEGDFFSANVGPRQANRDVVRGQFIGPKFLKLRFDLSLGALRLGLAEGGSIDVDWGDGNGWVTETRNVGDGLIWKSNSSYPQDQEFADVLIRFDENFSSWQAGPEGVVEVLDWGNQEIPSFVNMFAYSVDLVSVPTKDPGFAPGTSLERMFYECHKFNTDISDWVMSGVINMDGMLHRCYDFDAPIGKWDVSNVTSANSFLDSSEPGTETWAFDQDLSSWDNPAFRVSDFDYDLPIHTKPEFQPQNW